MNASTTFTNSVTTTAIPSDVINPYEQDAATITLWSLLYAMMILVALFGNLGICWLILRKKKLRTVTNYFLSSTALADSIVIALNTVFNFIYIINGNRWIFGRAFCHFFNFLPVGAVCASILSITVISIDRFILVVFPMRQRISKRSALLIIVAIWCLALLIAFPQAYFAVTTYHEGRVICILMWPSIQLELSYQVFFMVLTYWLPLVILAIAYLIMGKQLRGNNNNGIGNANETQTRRKKKNKKAVHMMVLVVILFAICYLPYQFFFVITQLVPEILNWSGTFHVYLSVFWLAMSHAMYNPIIYCWANPRFRDQFMALMRSTTGRSRNPEFARYSRRTSNRSYAEDKTICIPMAAL